MTKRNRAVDMAKMVAAVCVIGIHAHPLGDIGGFPDFLVSDVLFRWAVPFFAVCTGYYLSFRTTWRSVWRFALRVLWLYIGWSLFYLYILAYSWSKTGLLTPESFVGWFKSALLGGSYYHLWYLAQLFWGILFYWLIVRFVPKHLWLPLIVVLWLLGCYEYVYSTLIGGTKYVVMFNRFGALTGSTVRILPLLLTGAIIAEHKPALSVNKYFIGAVMALMGLVAEALLLRANGATRFSYIIFTLPLAFFLFTTIESFGANRVDGEERRGEERYKTHRPLQYEFIFASPGYYCGSAGVRYM